MSRPRIDVPLGISIVLLMLAGCSSPATSNMSVCTDFESAVSELDRLIRQIDGASATQSILDDTEEFRGTFDDLSLRAEGDVKTRLDELVAELPEQVALLSRSEFQTSDDYESNVIRVIRACDALK